MANEYKIKLEVRGRTSEFGADSVTELLLLMAEELFRMDLLTLQANAPNKSAGTQDSNNAAAQRLIEQYYIRFDKMDNRSDTLIFRVGKDIDLARCYLARMTIEETVMWLKKERKFKASQSAVGRYFRRFAQLPVAVKIA